MIPIHAFDRDGDDHTTFTTKPVQISGTGRMTAAAWVQSLNSVTTQDAFIRVVKVGRDYHLGHDDLLQDPNVISLPVASQATAVPPRLVSGLPTFVVTEAADSSPFDFRVDMAWTCATPTALEDVAPPLGYMFDLEDLGCPVAWPQRFVIRPHGEVMTFEGAGICDTGTYTFTAEE